MIPGSSKWLLPFKDERGGVHILLFSLLAVMSIVWIWIIALNWMSQSLLTDKTKPILDISTHAASLDIDKTEAAYGRLVWDSTSGTTNFYKYLRKNLKLDDTNVPLAGSSLKVAPIIHYLEFVSNTSYPYYYQKSVTVYGGTAVQTTRNIKVTIYGPSVVAIMEVRQSLLGLGRSEPLVFSSVSSVRLR